jgi:hypothetical protein
VGPPEAFASLHDSKAITENYESGPIREKALERFRPRLYPTREMNGKRERFPPSILDRPPLPASGQFRLDGIPPGLWKVMILRRKWMSHTYDTHQDHYVGSVFLESGKTTEFNPQLENRKPAHLRASVSLNGVPCANRRGRLLRWASFPSLHLIDRTSFKTNAQGEFDADVKPGSYSLLIDRSSKARPYAEVLPATEIVTLAAGPNRPMRFSVQTTSLSLEITWPDATPAKGILRQGPRAEPLRLRLHGHPALREGPHRHVPPQARAQTQHGRIPHLAHHAELLTCDQGRDRSHQPSAGGGSGCSA